jgi:predicted  nucleic acid-binding Zn-ribbon protein
MHPDIEPLLELQRRDLALRELDRQLARLRDEVAALDAELERARVGVDDVRRALQAAVKRREDVEAKVEGLRVLQERRRQRVELAKTTRELQALSAELELARSVLAKEEAEWFRQAEQVQVLEQQVEAAEQALAEQERLQETVRQELARRIAEVELEREQVQAERRARAEAVTPALLQRYERLRSTRQSVVVVALHGDACGNCHTAVPMSRRSHLRTGHLVEACEACGVLLYAALDSHASPHA